MPVRGLSALLLSLVLLLAACAEEAPPAPAEPKAPVEAASSVDRAVATTGDVLTYTVTVDYDPAYTVEIPEPGAEIAGFRITDLGREEPREAAGRVIEERWYRLRADLVGSYVLPPVSVTYSASRPSDLPDEEEDETADESESATSEEAVSSLETVQTSAIFVEVESVLPGDGDEAATDIRDLKPLQEVAPALPWVWIIAGAAALLLLLVAFLLLRRRPAKVVPPEPAHEVAFRELNALRGTDFTDPEAVRRFYFRISEVVRTYVEGRFGLNATDLTTEEIVAELPKLTSLQGGPRQQLETFLEDTDRVKFADSATTEDEIGSTYDRALSFVEETRPLETPEAEGLATNEPTSPDPTSNGPASSTQVEEAA